jgi:hypothetical protein
VLAKTARSAKIAGFPDCRWKGRISGVLTQKFGLKKADVYRDTSVAYSVSSAFDVRHVKYV